MASKKKKKKAVIQKTVGLWHKRLQMLQEIEDGTIVCKNYNTEDCSTMIQETENGIRDCICYKRLQEL